MYRARRRTEVKIDAGQKFINMGILDGHVMMYILSILPIDENFCCARLLAGEASKVGVGMSWVLERDCDELVRRMRKPFTYGRIKQGLSAVQNRDHWRTLIDIWKEAGWSA